MATNNKKSLRDFESFDDMVSKRAEVLGGDGTTFPITGFGKEWHLAAPDMQSADWNDTFTALHMDLQDGLIGSAGYRDELLDLILGEEQADEFRKACDKANGGKGVDPAPLINRALEAYNEDRRENPTRPKSQNGRQRPRRR